MSLAYLRRHAQPCPRRCKLAIVWTVTENGRRMAVNLNEEVMSQTAVRVDGAGTIRSRVLSDDFPLMPLETLHLPHAAVCKPQVQVAPKAPSQRTQTVPEEGLATVTPIWKARSKRSQ